MQTQMFLGHEDETYFIILHIKCIHTVTGSGWIQVYYILCIFFRFYNEKQIETNSQILQIHF